MKSIALLLLLFILLNSCNRVSRGYNRTVINDSAEIFIYKKGTMMDQDSLKAMAAEIDLGLNMESITKSNADLEMRIFYSGNWFSRSFRQIVTKDSAKFELVQCFMVDRNDSLFMRTGTKINAKGLASKSIRQMLGQLPVRYEYEPEAVPALDNINYYFIQLKVGASTKLISINNPYDVSKGKKSQKIAIFLSWVADEYSFKFYDEWPEIVRSAFISQQ